MIWFLYEFFSGLSGLNILIKKSLSFYIKMRFLNSEKSFPLSELQLHLRGRNNWISWGKRQREETLKLEDNSFEKTDCER